MKKESLNEELNRMKKLMNFDISENSHDVLSENVIKTVNRIDEQIVDENLPSINFEKSFKNNMVFVDGNNSEVQNAINQLDGYIQKSKDDEKELKSIDITINAGSSELRATNRLPEGVTKPDHDYGGIVPANMWTTVDKRVQSAAITQIPPSYNPNQGYYAIKDGNKYLAQKRAENLQKYLNEYLNKKYSGSAIKINIVGVNQTKKKFVNAVIDSIVFEIPDIPENRYIIIYDWYQIGGKDTPYVLIDGENSKYDKKLQHSQWGRRKKNLSQSFVDAVEATKSVSVAGYTKTSGPGGRGVGEIEFYAFGTFNGFNGRKGSIFYYTDEESWLSDVKKINMMNPAEKTIVNGLDGIYAKGVYVKGEKGTADFNHGYGTILTSGTKLYLIKPEGVKEPVKVIQIKGVDKQSTPKASL
jgi:hypothetical protein